MNKTMKPDWAEKTAARFAWQIAKHAINTDTNGYRKARLALARAFRKLAKMALKGKSEKKT